MKSFFLLLISIYCIAFPVLSQDRSSEIFPVTESLKEIDLSPYIAVMPEDNLSLSFAQVSSGKYDSLFSPNNAIDIDKNKRRCWARIKIGSAADDITSWILKTDKRYSNVICYIVYPDGKTIIQKSGWAIPPSKRNINGPDVIFSLSVAGRQTAVVYLQISTDPRWSTLGHVKATLFSQYQWSRTKWKNFAFLLFYTGISLLAIFFWLITYMYSKRVNYLYLVMVVLSMCTYYLDSFGVTAELFWSGASWRIFKYSHLFVWLFVCLSLIISMSKMNHLRDQAPNMNGTMWAMTMFTIVLYFMGPVFLPWKYSHPVCLFLSFADTSLGLCILLYVWLFKGIKSSRFTFFTTLPLTAGMHLFFLYDLGMMPDRFALSMIGPAGSGITVIFMFYGMVNYITALREKREKELLEKQVMIERQNVVLEQTIESRTLQLVAEKKKSDDLLLNMFPAEVAAELKEKGVAHARQFDEVTVLFTDFVNFTEASASMSPEDLIDELHTCFKAFDEITARHNIEKIKTIGDAYLAVCGLPTADPMHAENVVSAAIGINTFMYERRANRNNSTFEIRIGIHSGSVVAGIVGVKKFAYDIWGDTVNTAARMEQNSEPGRINISQTTYELVKDKFASAYRGEIDAKGKGQLKMYYVNASSDAGVPKDILWPPVQPVRNRDS